MTALIVSMVVSMALGLATTTYSEIMNSLNGNVRQKLSNLTSDIQKVIAENSALKEQLYDAYQTNNSNLMTQLLNSMGFGTRYNKIKQSITSNRNKYQDAAKDIDQKNAQATALQSKVNDQVANTYNTTISGYNEANKVINDVNNNLANGGLKSNASLQK